MKTNYCSFILVALCGCAGVSSRQARITPLTAPQAAKVALEPLFPKIVYDVQGFTLVVEQKELIRQMVEARLGITNAMGYFDGKSRTLYVPYSERCDELDRPLPDMDTLGHEVWHLPELGHLWHTNPPVNAPDWKPK